MTVFVLPGDGPKYCVNVSADGFRSWSDEETRPVYSWRITDAAGVLVSLGSSMTLAGPCGADHDLDDAFRRLARKLARDGKALAEEDTKTIVYYRWMRSEREFFVATWERWNLVDDSQDKAVSE